jgi:basic amino acid/polyamine antiporter, APA family
MNLFRRKSLSDLVRETGSAQERSLKRSLGPVSLTLLGLGAMIGSGIFVLTGTAAALSAGPAVVVSFVVAGVTAILAGLCYAEFAALIPVSGSAYTYTYATLGEIFAWVIGWDLILEYGLGAVTMAIGCSGYLVSLLHDVRVDIPCRLIAAPGTLVQCADGAQASALFNLPALLIVIGLTILTIRGIKESASANSILVFVNLAVILIFVLAAAKAVNSEHWRPFVPPPQIDNPFGWYGIVAGAGLVFFGYLGFDAISLTAEEARNPNRDVPVAIVGSVLICTLLYVLVAGIATGVVSYEELNVANPIGLAADRAGLGPLAVLIKLGAVGGLVSVILVLLVGQSRVVFSLARDGLLPSVAHRIHPRFRTPYVTSSTLGAIAAVAAAVVPLRDAAALLAVGTLLAFFGVAIGAVFLRIRQPNRPRPVRTPIFVIVAPLSALLTLYLMLHLGWAAWLRFVLWGVAGLIIYAGYGVRHSRAASTHDAAP